MKLRIKMSIGFDSRAASYREKESLGSSQKDFGADIIQEKMNSFKALP